MISGLLCLLVAPSVVALFQQVPAGSGESAVIQKTKGGLTDAPLLVPVYPHLVGQGDVPAGVDLRDSYIVLDDGSALSVADWILGGLKKDRAGADMSDYESRLFLGQVARAALGMDERLVKPSLVYTVPTATFKPLPAKAPEFQVLEYLIKTLILPGTPENYSPATVGGAFSPTMKTGDTGTILFERQFNDAIQQTRADFQEAGIMLGKQKAYEERATKSQKTAPN